MPHTTLRTTGGHAIAAIGALMLLLGSLSAVPSAAQESSGVTLVKSLYAAFGNGDIATILAGLADDVEWEIVGPQSACPCYGARKGRPAVEALFNQISERHDYKAFTPREFFASGDTVLVIGRHELVVKQTGRPFAADWVHIFRIKGGKVTSFRELTDTAAYVEAAR